MRAWFDQVLPLLAARQLGAGGSVIMVQLENELDFFDCADRPGYLTALRDQAVAHGIDVPLIACAGQGDLFGATGDVEGVVPACNFYPNDDSPFIEDEVRRYAALLADRGLPLPDHRDEPAAPDPAPAPRERCVAARAVPAVVGLELRLHARRVGTGASQATS